MSEYLDSLPDPDYDEMLLLTADEYRNVLAVDGEDEARRRFAFNRDLQHEIDAQNVVINELIEDYAITDDSALPEKIEQAKRELGHMLVDKLNLTDS